MSRSRLSLGVSVLLLVLGGTRSQGADQILIAAGSGWRFNDSGSNLGTAWRSRTYNDAAWPTGSAQLGYGDGDEATVISYGSNPNNRRITYYFRRGFVVSDPAAIASLTVRFVRDDGCVVYLNGVEVTRSNMPAGTISSTTRASAAIGGADESAWLEAPVDPALLVAGTNVIAVEVHQQSPTSSDVSFDLELRAAQAQTAAPTVGLVAPLDQSATNDATVTFTASVSAAAGLSSAALYVGDAPTTVVFSGPAQVEDAQITAETPTLADGSAAALNVDGQTPHAHVVMKVPSLIGSGSGQVPAGAIVTSAILEVNCTNPGQSMRLYRVTQDWIEDEVSWSERAVGVPWASPGADGAGSNAGVSVTGDCTVTGQRSIDITSFVQEWSSGAPNHGLVLIESGTDGVDFDSSESGAPPSLRVVYKNNQQPVETQPVSGASAQVSFSPTLASGRQYQWNVRVTDLAGQHGWAPADFLLTVDEASPDEPVLVAPADGATGVETSPTLHAMVSSPAGGTIEVTAEVRPATAPEFTIVALPDTQHYSESFPAIFTSQTQWIVNNQAARNIVFVTHEGDIVEHNSLQSEWLAANASMSLLDGVVPYGMGPGNHDQPTTLYNQYFPYTRYQGLPWYGGHFQNLNDNNYQLFSAGGMDFVIVHLAFCPPAAAVSWADSVLKAHPDRVGMMTTHGYLGLQAQRSVHVCNSTQYLWDGLAVPNPNLWFMLSGHVHGESRRTDTMNGHAVFQMLADYQDRASGGEGWLRILRFVPADNKVYVQTYSPWLNRFETDADSEFSLDFPMSAAFATVGSAAVPSGAIASLTAAGLTPNTQYEWRVTATNEAGRSRVGPVWRFTTGSDGGINLPPTAADQSVTAIEDTSAVVTLTGADPEGQALAFSIVQGPAHGTLSGEPPALTYQPALNFNGLDTLTFRVSDGQGTSTAATVSIDVQPRNDPPGATGDAYSVASGDTLSVSAPGVLGNDTDIDTPTLQAQLVAGPSNGVLGLNADGSFSYTPAAGYSGPDAFTYAASDGESTSGVATVALTILPPADATPPIRSNGQPAGTLPAGTAAVVLSLTTHEAATCRYGIISGTSYPAMPNVFAATGGTAHSTPVNGLVNGAGYAYQVRCRDAAGNENADDFGVAFAVALPPPDTTAPSVAVTSPSAGAMVSGTITVTATAADNVAVLGVQFLLDGAPLGAEDTSAPYSLSWNSATASSGSHDLSARARDAAGNQAAAAIVPVTVNAVPTGLVAAYSFNEGSGGTLIDRTGNGRTGTLSGATWTTSGRFGGALSFDGVNDWVTVADANALDLTTGMTLEAWVHPTANGGGSWRNVVIKERSGGEVYNLYANTETNVPTVYVVRAAQTGTPLDAAGTTVLPLNGWTHLAATHDGTTLRLYVNGSQVGTRAVAGALLTSTGALRIGGNSIWGEFFQGRIDEVRIYNRALAAVEIQADMLAAIQP